MRKWGKTGACLPSKTSETGHLASCVHQMWADHRDCDAHPGDIARSVKGCEMMVGMTIASVNGTPRARTTGHGPPRSRGGGRMEGPLVVGGRCPCVRLERTTRLDRVGRAARRPANSGLPTNWRSMSDRWGRCPATAKLRWPDNSLRGSCAQDPCDSIGALRVRIALAPVPPAGRIRLPRDLGHSSAKHTPSRLLAVGAGRQSVSP